MHHFAPQLHPDHHSASLRATLCRKKRKSRHDDDGYDGHDARLSSPHSDADTRSRSPPSNALSHPSFAPAELAQLRVAGLLPNHNNNNHHHYHIPPSPFPHAPATVANPPLGAAHIQKELAAPPARLFTVNTTASSHAEPTNLRRSHLNVLSTVMHTCLLRADYQRAGRAWGMILRTHATHGTTVDLRNHGRWAIGAEILLRQRKPQQTPEITQSPSDGELDHVFTEQGFELAREYYERLIVQHPTRKQAPRAVDQRSFYPAMFSLWIQEVCEKSRRARKQSAEQVRSSRSRTMSIDSGDGQRTHDDEDAQLREDAIQAQELARAMEIVGRLDDLVKSPPFDKQASLLQLRGNIALWISDLLVGNTPATLLDEWDVYPINSAIPATEQMARFRNCQRELRVAETYLSRVEENGGPRQHRPLKKIESRLKELQKQIAKLDADTNADTEDDATNSMDDDTNVDMDDDRNIDMEDAW